MTERNLPDRIARIAFIVAAIALVVIVPFLYGVAAQTKKWPPVPFMRKTYKQMVELVKPSDAILESTNLRYETPVDTPLPDAIQPGLVLVAGDFERRKTAIRILDRDGQVIDERKALWSDVWPDAEDFFASNRIPQEGMYLHGLDILPDGDIIANFEHMSTFRMDVCGNVVWKLDNLGHHSVNYDGDGAVWVSAETPIPQDPTGYPNHKAPLRSWTLQKIDLDGNILTTVPVIDILQQNGLEGLLYLSTLRNGDPMVTGDTLHLNDIESFPADMEPGLFGPGDLVISLRNINTVLVVDSETFEAKFVSTGRVVRQHDADFLSGDRLSVFDNYNIPRPDGTRASRIVELDSRTGDADVVFEGTGEQPFFTDIMGLHQRLENGNMLLVESGDGRVLEFTEEGDLAWRYSNRATPDKNLRVYFAKVLPPEMDAAFFEERKSQCATPG